MAEQSIRFERLSSHIGAMVHGFDPDAAPQAATSKTLDLHDDNTQVAVKRCRAVCKYCDSRTTNVSIGCNVF